MIERPVFFIVVGSTSQVMEKTSQTGFVSGDIIKQTGLLKSRNGLQMSAGFSLQCCRFLHQIICADLLRLDKIKTGNSHDFCIKIYFYVGSSRSCRPCGHFYYINKDMW